MSRAGLLVTASLAAAALVVPALHPMAPRLLWNASASTPIGLYLIRPGTPPAIGDIVAVAPPDALARFLAGGGYLPDGVPLLKHVVALKEQTVCRTGLVVTVDGKPVARALSRDRRGRALPVWQGCRRLGSDEVFLLNPEIHDSLDGRYFGPLPLSAVIGVAVPLWIERPDDEPKAPPPQAEHPLPKPKTGASHATDR
ncbi:S26 family signal peptidase [Zavarzinia sp.]|uniref:S26 family signal peptidase n=1 Tax=Zavarzinia sp. TaxID=2027920 RepID=UPI003BB5725B